MSICIPSFNHARFLPAAIDSALAQTYPRVEVVIADDGSTDGSVRIAETYASRHPGRVKVFVHDGRARRGISATANLAFEQSSGDYWCGLCSDDAFYPDKLERQVSFLGRHPEIGMVYGEALVIDAEGRPVGRPPIRDLSRDPDPIRRLLQENCIWGQTAMVRRECFETVGLHDEDLMYSDWELWIRIAARYKIGFLPRAVTYYRVHGANSSVAQPAAVQRARHVEVMKALRRKAAAAVEGGLARPFNRALLELQLAFLSFCAREYHGATEAMRSALQFHPAVFCDVPFLASWLRHRQAEIASFTGTPEADFLSWFATHASPLLDDGIRPQDISVVRRSLRCAVFLARWGVRTRKAYGAVESLWRWKPT